MYIKYYSIIKIAGSALNPALSFFLISIIGTEKFGELSTYQLIFGFSSILLTMGIKNTYLSTDKNNISIAEIILLKVIFIGSAITGIFCASIIYYGKGANIDVSLLLIFYFAATIPPLYELLCSAMQSEKDFKNLTLFEVTYLISGILGYSIALANTSNLTHIAAAINFTYIAPIVYFSRKTLSIKNIQSSGCNTTKIKILKAHLKYWKTSAIEATYRNLDSLIIAGGSFSNVEVGSFNIAKKLLALSYQPINIYLHNISIASYFALGKVNIFKEKFHQRIALMSFIYGSVVFTTSYILNEVNFFDIIHLPQFTSSLTLFSVLSIVAPFYFLNTSNSLALTAMSLIRSKNTAYIAATISLPLTYALFNEVGIIKIIYAIIISEILLLTYLTITPRKYLNK